MEVFMTTNGTTIQNQTQPEYVTKDDFNKINNTLEQVVNVVNKLGTNAAEQAAEEERKFNALSKAKQAKVLYQQERKELDEMFEKEEHDMKLKYAKAYKELSEKYDNDIMEGIEEDNLIRSQEFEKLGAKIGNTVAPLTKRVGGFFSGFKKIAL